MSQILIFSLLLIPTFLWPYLGIVITAASLPVLDLLPPIPGFTSAISLVGAMTFAGFLVQRSRDDTKSFFHFGSVHTIALLFVGWVFISNPQASFFGTGRNWILTFAKLWILLWLSGELLDTPKKQHFFMWVFSIVVIFSASFAIQNGYIGYNVQNSVRDAGLADGVNAAARYFVVGMVFFNYLRNLNKRMINKLGGTLGMIISATGVFYSTSRTGIVILFIAFALMIQLNPYAKNKIRLLIILLITAMFISFLSENLIKYMGSIVTNIFRSQDTLGLRYELWEVGVKMWRDYIIQGVGIGRYSTEFSLYSSQFKSIRFVFEPDIHNMYLQVLVETGLVGFFIFILLLFKSLQNIWRITNLEGKLNIEIRNVWLIAFIVMLFGGLMKTDTTDKLIWVFLGVSQHLYWKFLEQKREPSTPIKSDINLDMSIRTTVTVQKELDYS